MVHEGNVIHFLSFWKWLRYQLEVHKVPRELWTESGVKKKKNSVSYMLQSLKINAQILFQEINLKGQAFRRSPVPTEGYSNFLPCFCWSSLLTMLWRVEEQTRYQQANLHS